MATRRIKAIYIKDACLKYIEDTERENKENLEKCIAYYMNHKTFFGRQKTRTREQALKYMDTIDVLWCYTREVPHKYLKLLELANLKKANAYITIGHDEFPGIMKYLE